MLIVKTIKTMIYKQPNQLTIQICFTGFVLAIDFIYVITRYSVNMIMKRGWCSQVWQPIPAGWRTSGARLADYR